MGFDETEKERAEGLPSCILAEDISGLVEFDLLSGESCGKIIQLNSRNLRSR